MLVTYLDKVDEVIVVLAEDSTSDWVTAFAAALGHTTSFGSDQPPVLVEKVLALAALVDHLFGRHAYPHDE